MFFNIFSYLQLSASSEISRSTPNDIVYYSMTTDCLVAMDRTNITFRARANNDISLALGSEDSSTSGTHYQIVIGGWSNTKSVIRFAIAGSACVYYNGSSLSQSFFDEFWVSWTGGFVRVGTGSSVGSGTIMTCPHSKPYTVNFIWIMTGYGSSGEWRFINGI